MHRCAHAGEVRHQRQVSSSITSHLVFETRSFTDSESTDDCARLADQRAPWVLLAVPPGTGTAGAQGHTPVCTWVLEIQT